MWHCFACDNLAPDGLATSGYSLIGFWRFWQFLVTDGGNQFLNTNLQMINYSVKLTETEEHGISCRYPLNNGKVYKRLICSWRFSI